MHGPGGIEPRGLDQRNRTGGGGHQIGIEAGGELLRRARIRIRVAVQHSRRVGDVDVPDR
nr:hypothetical protein [Rhodococcus opacus]